MVVSLKERSECPECVRRQQSGYTYVRQIHPPDTIPPPAAVRIPHKGDAGDHPLDDRDPIGSPTDRIETPTQIEATMRKHTEETALLTPSEVAILFRVSPKTVTRWAKEGKLPYIRTLGGHRRYPARDVRALAEAGFEDPVAAAS